MRLLVDNNVPRGVTLAFREYGHEALEVRSVLAHNAADAAVAAYAAAEGYWVVTHDRGLAKKCRLLGVRHLLLRCPEPADRQRVVEVMDEIEARLGSGFYRATVRETSIRFE